MLESNMKIPKDNINQNNFYMNPSIENLEMEDIELDLASKPNVFSKVHSVPIYNQTPKRPKSKRINAMDSQLFFNEIDNKANDHADKLQTNNFEQFTKTLGVAFRGLLTKLPVINYFVMKDKHDRLKQTISNLNSINSNVDEMMKTSMPYGEQAEVYKVLTENIMKANNIHSQIQKEIGD